MGSITMTTLKIFLLNRLGFNNIGQTKQDLWVKNGCQGSAPHLIKEITIVDYKIKFGYTTLIETGTYLGDMVDAMKIHFQKIISIELSPSLFKSAKNRFKQDDNIEIVQGDSSKLLPKILKKLKEPVIFWLDGHYSSGFTAKGEKECPILEELDAIFNNNELPNVILIDDARCFNGNGDYPTIEQLLKKVKTHNDRYTIEIKYDIIRFVVN